MYRIIIDSTLIKLIYSHILKYEHLYSDTRETQLSPLKNSRNHLRAL